MKRWKLLNPMSKRIPLTIFCINLLLTGLAYGADLYVPSPYTTIQAAIDAAVDGDTVIVSPGQYSPISINKAITVQSSSPEDWDTVQNTWIHGNYWYTGAYISGDATLKGFRFTSCGTDYYGGAICIIGGSPTISNCLIQYNSTDGIRCQYAYKPVITNCKILNNSGGGIMVEGCYPTVKNCIVSGGVGVQYSYYYGSTFYNCTVAGDGSYMGSRVEVSNSSPNFINTIFYNTTFVDGGNVNWSFNHCCNSIGSGPVPDAFGNFSADPDFVDPVNQDYHLEGNSACVEAGVGTEAGDYDLDGEPRINGSAVDMGSDEFVARVHNTNPVRDEWYHSIRAAIHDSQEDDELVINPGTYLEQIQMPIFDIVLRSTNPDDWAVVESTIIDAQQKGRVITFTDVGTSACMLEGLTITGGRSVNAHGAGICGNTNATIRRCIIRDNTTVTGGNGAGLFQVHGLVEDCKILNNHAIAHGGAISGTSATIRNCLIAGNSAGGDGGAINNCWSPDATRGVFNCTIANNHANGTGGGFRWVNNTYSSIITNGIIWGNTDGNPGTTLPEEQIYTNGSICTVTYSCVQGGWTGNISDNPLFVDADGADNTYGTLDDDYRIGFSSDCVDTGTDIGIDTDINGEERLTNHRSGVGIFDMGAYECRIFESGQQTPEDWTYDYVYYGHLHNHSSISDGGASNTPLLAYSTAKLNELDFFSLADHGESLDATKFASMKTAANTYLQKRLFTTFWGFEWSHSTTYGHVAVIKAPDDVALEYCTKSNPSTFAGLMSWLDARDCIAFFNHPGRNNGSGHEFEHFTGAFSDKIVGMELWNKDELFDIFYDNIGYTADGRTRSGNFDEALYEGWRIGAAGSEDNHSGTWGGSNYRLAVLANANTRADIYAALQARRFYSTLDKNLMLSFEVNGQPMGSQLAGGSYPCIVKAKDADGEVFSKIELIINGCVVGTVNNPTIDPVYSDYRAAWDLVDLQQGDYIYCKVTQVAEGTKTDEAISSPIFVISSGPRATWITPLDNGQTDLNPAQNGITASTTQPNFQIFLSDLDGVNDATVTSAVVSMSSPNYSFHYDTATDIISLQPTGNSVFGNGTYTISLAGGMVSDTLGEFMPAKTFTVVIDTSLPQTLRFQQVFNDYFGASDTMLRGDKPSTPYSTTSPIKVDTAYDTLPSHGLLRFDNIIGSAPGQIPQGAIVSSAILRLRSTDNGHGGKLHAMLVDWSDTATWNSLVNGIQANDVEAKSTVDASIPSNSKDTDNDFNVTARVQAWVNGTLPNRGWAVLPNGSDGWEIGSAEIGIVDYRPELIVTYTINQ